MAKGRVKWWDDEKGFGFITDLNGKDLFVHSSEIKAGGFQMLEEGAIVEFEEVAAKNGPMAINVRLSGVPITPKLNKSLPATYVKSFSALTIRQIEHEANERSLELSHRIRFLSITQAIDGKGYVAAVIYEQAQDK